MGDHDTTVTYESKSVKVPIKIYNNDDVIHEKYYGADRKLFPVNDIAILELRAPIVFSPL